MKFDIKMSNMVKGIAVIFMLAHHLFFCFQSVCEHFCVYSSWVSFSSVIEFSEVAKVCVAMYVFLSTYGITVSINKKKGILNDRVLFEKETFSRYVKLSFNFIFIYILALLTSFLRTQSISQIYNVREDGKAVLYGVIDMLGLADYFATPSLNETWWYMSLAYTLVFIVPLIVLLYKRIGKATIMLAMFVGYFGVTRTYVLAGYALCAVVGVVFAEEAIFEKMYDIKIVRNEKFNSIIKIIVYILILNLIMELRGGVETWGYYDVFAPILLGACMMECYNIVPIICKPIGFIGKHSMNIFLIHTLIFEYYFMDFIYGFKHWLLILVALLVISLIVSIIIENLKVLLGYNKLIKRIVPDNK